MKTSAIDRRRFLLRGALFGASAGGLSLVPRSAWSAKDDGNPERTAVEFITPAAQQGIDSGLNFLAQRQNDDGSFGTGGWGRNVAVCSLAGMAFMSGGSTPGRGPYGAQVDRCVDYILANTQRRAASSTCPTPPATGRCTATASPRCSWPSATA